MRSRYENIIGIDPDAEKSGVAYLRPKDKVLELATLPFPALLDYLTFAQKRSKETGESLIVVVEAGWRVPKSMYHPYQGRRAEKIARDVGANQETGKKIIEMCKHYGIEVAEKHPLKKIWQGRDGKITHKELASFTGITGRTNQENRDAALIAWDFAELPIRIDVNSFKKRQ